MNTSNLLDTTGGLYLFKGPPKEGKSIAAHSFPDSYTFDFDDKIRMVKNYYPDKNFEYDTFEDVISVRKKIEEFKTRCDFTTLIVDGITDAANLAMRCLVAYRNPNWRTATTRANNPDKTVRAGIPMTEIEDYAGESKFLGDLVDDLKVVRLHNPHINIIVTAHVITTEVTDMKGDKRISTKNLVTWGNKISASLPGKFEEVFHFERISSLDDSPPRFICYTSDHNGNGAGTSLKIPGYIDWTDKDYYKTLQKHVRKELL